MKNKFEIRDDKVAIFLNRKTGKDLETIISREDLGRAQELDGTWYATWSKNVQSFYVYGNTLGSRGKRKGLVFHRWIMRCPNHLEVDHFNHDTLNNTRENIRNVTKSVNLRNRREGALRKSNTSGYKGVSFHKSSKRWRVQKMIDGKNRYFGSFLDLAQAVQVSLSLKVNSYG